MGQKKIKVRFNLDIQDWHGHGSETLWAEMHTEDDPIIATLLNSPFFTKGINNNDVVSTRLDENGMGDFIGVIQRGGHSTFMIIVGDDEQHFQGYWTELERLGCTYESARVNFSMGKRLLLSVDVPAREVVDKVVSILDKGEENKVWVWQDGYRADRESRILRQ